MATTSIIVNSTNSGKVLQKTITNVNPNADNDKLAAWGQMLTGLTDNTYTKTDRVDKANCDTEAAKTTPTLQLRSSSSTTGITEMTITGTGTSGATGKTVYYNGDGELYYRSYPTEGVSGRMFFDVQKSTSAEKNAYIMAASSATAGDYYVELYSTETENYKSATWLVRVTLTTS